MKNKKESISSNMLKNATLKELSTSSGEIEVLTPEEEKERMEAIVEMTAIKNK